MTEEVHEHMGIQEVANALGVSASLASKWHERGKLPEPAGLVSGVPIWHASVIYAFARGRSRARGNVRVIGEAR